MSLSLEHWVAIGSALVGGGWALIKAYGLLVRQIVAQFKEDLDKRFAASEAARAEGRKTWEQGQTSLNEKLERMDRELRTLLVDLPEKYVRREDYVRRETVIEAKIDQLSLRIQNWILESRNND